MNKTNAPPKYLPRLSTRNCLVVATVSLFAGCGSPPSVVPVLQVVRQALEEEAQRLDQIDAERDRLLLDQSREQLHQGYVADLEQHPALDPAWVRSATEVYVAAREALMRQEFNLAQQRAARRDNLRDAAEAQARAIVLLQQQDRLLQQTIGLDLWRLDRHPQEPSP